jgi:hypothetical protein
VCITDTHTHTHTHTHTLSLSLSLSLSISLSLSLDPRVRVCAPVRPDYFCNLDGQGRRSDLAFRPELRHGTIDMVAPAVRPAPHSLRHRDPCTVWGRQRRRDTLTHTHRHTHTHKCSRRYTQRERERQRHAGGTRECTHSTIDISFSLFLSPFASLCLSVCACVRSRIVRAGVCGAAATACSLHVSIGRLAHSGCIWCACGRVCLGARHAR